MTMTRIPLTEAARRVLDARILARDPDGNVCETPEDRFAAVAAHIAGAEQRWDYGTGSHDALAEQFYDLMASLDFLPNSPCLANAGKNNLSLSACYVLPIADSLDSIMDTAKHAALVHQTGGGTGFDFSSLRPAGSLVGRTGGVASGPVSFMQMYDGVTDKIKQGGQRRGANIGILRVDHPDIMDFIRLKADGHTLTNFNISVAITDPFLEALDRDGMFSLRDPRDGRPTDTVRARGIWDELITMAHKVGCPGLFFVDRVNRSKANPIKGWKVSAPNPCGEVPLYDYDSCNLGSLNLANFVRNGDFDWERLSERISLAVRFLDDVIEANNYPLPQITAMTQDVRRIGLGVMGWADALYKLRIPYDSQQALALARNMAGHINHHAREASHELANDRGGFPLQHQSIYVDAYPIRNSTRTAIAPTGTISIIAGTSSGIEPNFGLAFQRQHHLERDDALGQTKMFEVNPVFLASLRQEAADEDRVESIMRRAAEGMALRDVSRLIGFHGCEWMLETFITSHEIASGDHLAMQEAWQEHTDNGVSKTVNLPNEATVDDVRAVYEMATKRNILGVTIYRDGSREEQVLSHIKKDAPITVVTTPASERRRLPDTRQSITHKFNVGGQEGYIHLGMYEDGSPGELFLSVNKQGSTVAGLMESIGILTSLYLQRGGDTQELADKFRHMQFEPSGMTTNKDIPVATSLVDYIYRWANQHTGGQEPSRVVAEEVPTGELTGLTCAMDGTMLRAEGGCLTCPTCGYKTCGG